MLGHIPVKSLCHKAILLEYLRQLIHLGLCITENQGKLRLIIFQKPDAGSILVLPCHPVIALGNQRNGQFLCRYLHKPCIFLEPAGNIQNRLGHGCRKKSCLMFSGNLSQNQLHILSEAHVQHFICLVQHHHGNLVQLNRMAAHMIHHTSRRSHNNLHSS